ncbi:MAG: acetyl/propionyl/methylcrotonyl-CoA carboxylase subunit alpha [Hyphomicrobiaceae bacterium]
MFKKVLVANRGEIACRICRTARAMGLGTVAVYSDADIAAMHVRLADDAVRIGPGPAADSYLRIEAIIAAAVATGADCVHPGYGFLAENPDFAEACAAAGLVFIGPSPRAMRALGNKSDAKQIAISEGVPIVPGYLGNDQDLNTLLSAAGAIGYPLMIKAVSGGGGRGMRRVEAAPEFQEALASAQREAQSTFGDARVLIEKLVVRPRHVEVQIFGDRHGDVVHLFERDCTLQRRNQKVMEEAPAPDMSPALRANMTDAAIAIAKSVGYEGAGTVEFLVEGGSLDSHASWYFIEMNTRLQVEHPVTEQITGLDIVEWQFRVAAGEPLPLHQQDITCSGHAIEVRLCSEDPANDFSPSVGQVLAFNVPEADGLRVESGFSSGDSVPPFYDSMIAKIIRFGPNRADVIERLRHDLENFEIIGVKTNLGFLHALLSQSDVVAARMSTSLIADQLHELVSNMPDIVAIAEGARVILSNEMREMSGKHDSDPWAQQDAFQLGGDRRMLRALKADGVDCEVAFIWSLDGMTINVNDCFAGRTTGDLGASQVATGSQDGIRTLIVDQDKVHVFHSLNQTTVCRPAYDVDVATKGGGSDGVHAPINGRVARLMVSDGEFVSEGVAIAVVEAMKMEHVLNCPRAGQISKVHVAEDDQVSQGELLVSLEAERDD